MGPPSESYLYSGRQWTGRSSDYPFGNFLDPNTVEANLLADKISDQMRCFSAFGMRWVLEQPVGSDLPHIPCVSQAIHDLDAFKVVVWLGKWGGGRGDPYDPYSSSIALRASASP